MKFSKLIVKIVKCKLKIADNMKPLAILAARLLLAYSFIISGILKLPKGFFGVGRGNWNSTLSLFKYEYNIPIINAEFAAYIATSIEIIAPLMLIFGFGTRIAAFLLLCMTLTIEFTYMHNISHYYWACVAFILITHGGSILAVDHLIKKKYIR